MKRTHLSFAAAMAFAVLATGTTFVLAAPTPPDGFTAIFNGKDLIGWRGGDTFDHRTLLAMPAEKREAQIAKWNENFKPHWSIQNEELVNDGQGSYATTEKDYGDFELRLEYKTVAGADSGIYLRGVPQVQIWDYTDKAKFPIGSNKGSGGLWNNSPGALGKDPLVLADKPFGEWNSVRVLMLSILATNTTSLGYQWFTGGNPISGATNSVYKVSSVNSTMPAATGILLVHRMLKTCMAMWERKAPSIPF